MINDINFALKSHKVFGGPIEYHCNEKYTGQPIIKREKSTYYHNITATAGRLCWVESPLYEA